MLFNNFFSEQFLIMDTIFTLGDEHDDIKINLDELYEKKKQSDLNTLAVYNKILKRIHDRIRHTSRIKANEQFCWYLVPEMIIGVPKFDNGACIAYLIDKLRDNGFVIRYTHPNLLFIGWNHWMPGYVREEIKKKTGMVIDGYGNEKIKNDDRSDNNSVDNSDPNALIFDLKNKNKNVVVNKKNSSDYKDIDSYKPSGNLIYNQDLLRRIQDKSRKN